jgi:hypothetical protein
VCLRSSRCGRGTQEPASESHRPIKRSDIARGLMTMTTRKSKEVSIREFCDIFAFAVTRFTGFYRVVMALPDDKLPPWVIQRGRRRRIDIAKLPRARR